MTKLVTFNIKHQRVTSPYSDPTQIEWRVQYEIVLLTKGGVNFALSNYELESIRYGDTHFVLMMRARVINTIMGEIKAALEAEFDNQRLFSLDRGN